MAYIDTLKIFSIGFLVLGNANFNLLLQCIELKQIHFPLPHVFLSLYYPTQSQANISLSHPVHGALQQKEMSNEIGPTVKRSLNTAAYRMGRYSVHLLLLKSSMPCPIWAVSLFWWHCRKTSHSTTPHPINRVRRWYTVVMLLFDLCYWPFFVVNWRGENRSPSLQPNS